jgi:predicted Zn-dependent protease
MNFIFCLLLFFVSKSLINFTQSLESLIQQRSKAKYLHEAGHVAVLDRLPNAVMHYESTEIDLSLYE